MKAKSGSCFEGCSGNENDEMCSYDFPIREWASLELERTERQAFSKALMRLCRRKKTGGIDVVLTLHLLPIHDSA